LGKDFKVFHVSENQTASSPREASHDWRRYIPRRPFNEEMGGSKDCAWRAELSASRNRKRRLEQQSLNLILGHARKTPERVDPSTSKMREKSGNFKF